MNNVLLRFFTEISLIGFSLIVILSSGRILTEDDTLLKLVVFTLIVHIMLVIFRALKLTTFFRVIIVALCAVLAEIYLLVPDTLSRGVPTANSFESLRALIAEGTASFFEQGFPVSGGEELQIIFAILIAAVIILVEWSAFVYKKTGETLIPLLVILLFFFFAGEKEKDIWLAILTLAAASIFVLFHRLWLQTENPSDSRIPAGIKKFHWGMGIILAAIAVSFGTLLSVNVPGAYSEAIIGLEREPASALNPDDASRVLLNPLVDISNQLTNNPNIEVFRVQTSQPSYWRLTALDSFDGRSWSFTGSYLSASSARNDISSTRESASINVQHSFEISNLGNPWVPHSYIIDPRKIQSPLDISYNTDTSSLILRNRDLLPGDRYTTTSKQLQLTSLEINEISGSGGTISSELQQYTLLPDSFSPEIEALTESITSEGNTPYEKALLLEKWFHDEFTYNQEFSPGHGSAAIEEFLLNTREGFCEQFSGSFAAMARVLGIPSRVAVGFTAGEYSDTDPNTLIVRSKHAHAWPEIYIANLGWIRLEPTPSRGIVDETVSSLQLNNGEQIPLVQRIPPEGQDPSQSQNREEDIEELAALPDFQQDPGEGLPQNQNQDAVAQPGFESKSNTSFYLLISLFSILFLLYLAGVNYARKKPLSKIMPLDDSRKAIAHSWLAVSKDLSRLGINRYASETQLDFSNRASNLLRFQTDALINLATAVNYVQYAHRPPDTKAMNTAVQTADNLHAELSERISWGKKILRWINPAPAVRLVQFKTAGIFKR